MHVSTTCDKIHQYNKQIFTIWRKFEKKAITFFLDAPACFDGAVAGLWPDTTERGRSCLADLGLAPGALGDRYGVISSSPLRPLVLCKKWKTQFICTFQCVGFRIFLKHVSGSP